VAAFQEVEAYFGATKIFGSSLREIMMRKEETKDIPMFMERCLQKLSQEKCMCPLALHTHTHHPYVCTPTHSRYSSSFLPSSFVRVCSFDSSRNTRSLSDLWKRFHDSSHSRSVGPRPSGRVPQFGYAHCGGSLQTMASRACRSIAHL
jgi:hypothetical protein